MSSIFQRFSIKNNEQVPFATVELKKVSGSWKVGQMKAKRNDPVEHPTVISLGSDVAELYTERYKKEVQKQMNQRLGAEAGLLHEHQRH